MRKLIISAISLVALAAVIATPFANAATTDANGVVTVSKGDIQSAMGWNNAGWENYLSTHTVAEMGRLITTGAGNTPTAPDGGMCVPERSDRNGDRRLARRPGELRSRSSTGPR